MSSFIQVSGKPFHGIDFLGGFVKLVYDIGEKTAVGSKHAVSHISSKLSFRFGKVSGNFV